MKKVKTHRLQIINKGGICTKVILNEKPLRCYGYSISQEVGELPQVELKLFPQIEITANIIPQLSSEIDTLAELMTEEQFKEFVAKWKENHDIKDCPCCGRFLK